MKEQLEAIRAQADAELKQAESQQALEELRIKYLGKKGALTAILKQMGKLSAEERPVIGQLANQVRASIENELAQRAAEVKAAEQQRRLEEEKLDVTLPANAAKWVPNILFPSAWTKSRKSSLAWVLRL